jgi:glycosyl transferase family 2
MSDLMSRAPVATSPISVILLAHAAAPETADALKAWQTYLGSLQRPFEILLVQESSPNDPATETPPPPEPGVFTYERAVGFRAAVNAAVATAKHPLLVFCTADNQYQPAELERMLKLIDKVDLVAGYRTGGQAPPWRVFLDLLSTIFCRLVLGIPLEPRRCWLGSAGYGRRWIARWVFGVRVLDPECPIRLARKEIFKWPFQSGGPFLPVEMLAKANHLTCLMAEEGVSWTPPSMPAPAAISFGEDAWTVFQSPDFGQLPTAPPVEPQPQISAAPPA